MLDKRLAGASQEAVQIGEYFCFAMQGASDPTICIQLDNQAVLKIANIYFITTTKYVNVKF